MKNATRRIRQVLTNKWVLFLYPVLVTFLIISYMHCKYAQYYKVDNNAAKSNYARKSSIDIITIESYLFVLIMTSPKGKTKRKAMRETWLNNKLENFHIKHRFIVGTKDLNTIVLKELQEEQNTYADLLFLTEHKDSYNALTIKLLKSLLWVNRNVNTKFVMKVDDDTFVRLNVLVESLKKRDHLKRLYWGYFRGNSNVKRIGPWAEKNWFLSDHYLPYALGGGYLISCDLVEYISRVSDMLQIYNSEDVSLGVWLAPVKLNRIHDIRFDTEYKSRGCSNEHIVSHKQAPENMYEKFDNLKHNGKLCKKEKETLYTFDYNWLVPPSQCCQRVKRSLL